MPVGSGNARLSGDYPVSANLSFNNILYTRIAALMGIAICCFIFLPPGLPYQKFNFKPS